MLRVVAAAIVQGRHILVGQRTYPQELAGLWELPGGKVEPGESDEVALIRECREELAVELQVGAPLGTEIPAGRGDRLLQVLQATVRTGSPRALQHAQLRWVGEHELEGLAWVPANRLLIPRLRARLAELAADPAG